MFEKVKAYKTEVLDLNFQWTIYHLCGPYNNRYSYKPDLSCGYCKFKFTEEEKAIFYLNGVITTNVYNSRLLLLVSREFIESYNIHVPKL
jgi:hypothetical protein